MDGTNLLKLVCDAPVKTKNKYSFYTTAPGEKSRKITAANVICSQLCCVCLGLGPVFRAETPKWLWF